MASLSAIAEGAAAEEQMLVEEASSVSRNADLKKMRQDKREFIKVSTLLHLVWIAPQLQNIGWPSIFNSQHKSGICLQANRRALANSPKFGETFGKIQSTDMPPQFRAILEDNRVRVVSGLAHFPAVRLANTSAIAQADSMNLSFQMLHEQIRTYKRDLYDTQASNTAHDRHIMRLQAEMKRMHEALQVSYMMCAFGVCSQFPACCSTSFSQPTHLTILKT